jgi:uncharacterized membrane protein
MMSDYVTMTAFAASYDSLDAAEADYQAVKALYYGLNLMDTFDAAVLMKKDNGKVKIVKRHEQPTRQGAWVGAGMGLAAGLAIACFPAAVLGAGLLATTAGAGAAAGALAGHVAGGMSRADLKDIGESLDYGQAGLVVIAATDVGDRVANALKSAKKVVKKAVKANQKELDKELEAASY